MQNNVKESTESTCQQYRRAWPSVWLKLGLSSIQNDEFYQNWFGSELGYFWLTIISGINILNSIPHQSYGNKKRPSPIIYEASKHWMQQIPTCQWSIIRLVIVTHVGAETRQALFTSNRSGRQRSLDISVSCPLTALCWCHSSFS